MDLAAEQHPRTPRNQAARQRTDGAAPLILRIAVAVALMGIAANCFLKYLWWTACYSAWTGIPKLASQWRAAGARSSFFGWSVIVLVLATLIILYTAIRLPKLTFSTLLRTALRLAASLSLTVVGTGFLALVLSWVKQSH
jgi:hypothetical protein